MEYKNKIIYNRLSDKIICLHICDETDYSSSVAPELYFYIKKQGERILLQNKRIEGLYITYPFAKVILSRGSEFLEDFIGSTRLSLKHKNLISTYAKRIMQEIEHTLTTTEK